LISRKEEKINKLIAIILMAIMWVALLVSIGWALWSKYYKGE
jgi:hypothetical protein